ncbi:MAG: hypothetical protein NC187_06545 [Candidatus Amulumruptor caecigallinarius]|nr:hypothetical protein [Candidatus Amulumruptor caecigallinarius]MCM1397128.1 hypothetical protein [Candidatus Amulumruptor caecigallinarius]MCM1453938.1 hypothetical protein [bacterium]
MVKNPNAPIIQQEIFEFILNSKEHSLPLFELSIFLKNLDKLVLSINGTLCKKWNIGYDEIEVSVIALEKGSFKIPLSFKKVIKSPLFVSTAATVIGGFIVNSLNNSQQPITIINNEGGVINIYNDEIIQNPSTQESINEIATTVIHNDEVESLSLTYETTKDTTSKVVISKNTLHSVIRDIPDNEISNTLYKQELEIISPVFVAEPRYWKVLLNGKSVAVYLKDLTFLETMKAQGIAFGYGDKIVADIDIQTIIIEKSTKTKYTVTKVISYPRYTKITRQKQLPFINDETM